MAETAPFLSVVVTSYNQLALVRRLVGELRDQNYPASMTEIIVVDDASSDGTQEWLMSFAGELAVVQNPSNFGRSRSRNLAVKRARGEILLLIDGDHSVRRDFLEQHARRHLRERCVIVGKSTYVPHADYVAIHGYLDGSGAEKLPGGARLPGRYFLTRNCSLPRELFLRVGGLDERFSAWGGEDLDLGVRLAESGVPIYYEPAAAALHDHLRPLDEMLVQLREYGGSGIPLLLSKHPQLFVELNLDHLATYRSVRGRFGALHRMICRALITGFAVGIAKAVVDSMRRFRLPRKLFDYLVLSQYGNGYLSTITNKSRNTDWPNS